MSNKPNLSSIEALETEFEDVLRDFSEYHGRMEHYKDYYDHSAFYPPKSGSIRNHNIQSNLLKVFADKNMHYTSPFPKIKVLPDNTDEMSREAGNIREKVVLATHSRNLTPLLQKKWSFDGTVLSAVIAETSFNQKTREVEIRRLDPRFCFWQTGDDNDHRLKAFWTAYPISYAQVRQRYGVEPKQPRINTGLLAQNRILKMDGQEWTVVITRHDDTHTVSWVGDTFVVKAHKHHLGVFPIDVAFPFQNADHDMRGDFYLRQLVPLQAEFNETLRRRANIVRKLGNPAVWGRGVVSKQFDEIKRALQGDGGFVGLKANGELGVLQIPETKMLDNHLLDLFQQMKHISGFGSASFGESVGANTSGDALSMYFTPTTRAVEDQQIVWSEFYKSINSKILCLYRNRLRTNETKKLHGVRPHATLRSINPEEKYSSGVSDRYDLGSFTLEFTKDMLGDNYETIVIPQQATPKDEVAYKKLISDAVAQGFISHRTGYEEFGILSPEDELQLLEDEQSNPALNPQGISQLMGAQGAMMGDPMMGGMDMLGGQGVSPPEGAQDAEGVADEPPRSDNAEV